MFAVVCMDSVMWLLSEMILRSSYLGRCGVVVMWLGREKQRQVEVYVVGGAKER
jgi:hypothetical protein